MNRRKFISSAALGGIAIGSLSSFKRLASESKVTILHTNDTHSQIDPFPENHKYHPNQGGVNKRFTLIERIRAQEEQVLLLDSGDIFQGTPYFNVHGGELEMKVMSEMKYDCATLGNHDFDGGLDGFVKAMKHANFPFVSANYDFSDTLLANKTTRHFIFQKGDIKVGVFGIGVELDGLVPAHLYGKTKYLNPVEEANYEARVLKEDFACNLVICLSHLGYTPRHNEMCDTVLANETENIDLILGGHSHTFMEKPEMRKNKIGKSVLINQVGWAGLVLGRIDFYFDKKGNPDMWASNFASTTYSIS